jgi:hypothetical protein
MDQDADVELGNNCDCYSCDVKDVSTGKHFNTEVADVTVLKWNDPEDEDFEEIKATYTGSDSKEVVVIW